MIGDKFMSKLHFKTGRIYLSCLWTIYYQRIQKFRETWDLKHLYGNELDKPCFARDGSYSDSKDLAKRSISDNALKNRAYEITRSCQYQRALASMVYKVFDRKQDRK